ncbi:hypothetical protein GCK72_005553 [Caenorhabditis remanei]|uniref:Uncharacterized protein n=1 Tax=Caenorhabditis remanei TaxID=31234 RepID=A0A6A5HF46_CAERE|nr:hypothetical protein GCK72_005553 [Caenorhabditis remanei]KAF1765601.1 hypothetical protein GCK72_005553 [Caenorhabditis remanei]
MDSTRSRWRVVSKKKLSRNLKLLRGYLGVVQREIAERKLGILKFAVYHQLPSSPLLENMKTEITLACVFRSNRGKFTHFPIVEYINTHENIEYYVDTGSSKITKKFGSIEDLLVNYCRQ